MNIPYQDLRDNQMISPFHIGSVGAIGVDVMAYVPLTDDVDYVIIPPWSRALIKTGVALAVPPGYYCRVAPRSGLAWNKGIVLGGGVIDEDYRGELGVIMFNCNDDPFTVKNGDRVAQLIMEAASQWVPEKVDALGETRRGSGGFGSTGK